MGTVGIAGLGLFAPSRIVDAEELAAETGIPAAILRSKFGIRQVHRANRHEHVSTMAVAAGERALADAAVTPAQIDLVIYCGSEYKDYIVWSAAVKITHMLGCARAQAFEVYALCASMPLALRVAKNTMLAEPEIRTVLVVAASKESALVNRRNPHTRFMSNFGDGAAAAVLQLGLHTNRVLATASVVDGTLSEEAIIPAGGSRHPTSVQTVAEDAHYLDVPDINRMRTRLDSVSGINFQSVMRQALRASGRERIDFLAPVHVKRSMHDGLLRDAGMPRTFYLEDYGHMQAADQIVAVVEARQRGLLRDGDAIALLAAGVGYTWAATIVAWGEESSDGTTLGPS